MKRFIDLRGQIYNDDDLPKNEQTPVFAFFCTVRDQFETFGGEQNWESIEDFHIAYSCDKKIETDNKELFKRLRNLIPDWVPEK